MNDAIVIRELRKVYGSVVALESLNLSVPSGSVFGLLGPNGAGKSTTFGVLCGFLRASGGDTTVLGLPPQHLYRLHGGVAVLPQDASFPSQVSVGRQLRHYGRLMGLSPADAGQQAHEALTQVGLADVDARKGSELSHGMLKRVGLAQTLIGSPELILLDEPTAGLDPHSARQVKNLIARQAPRATVVVSSHNLADIQQVCTHGAILDKGRLAKVGTIDELTQRSGQITIELGADANPPLTELRRAFGEGNVSLDGATSLRILFPGEADAAEMIARALRVLLDEKTPVLGVTRGTSLEDAFLELTAENPSSA